MRCPGCHFVCSELRDLCPKCASDLRPYKASVGLPVSNPKASYNDLVKSAIPGKGGTESSLGKSLFGTLFSRAATPPQLPNPPLSPATPTLSPVGTQSSPAATPPAAPDSAQVSDVVQATAQASKENISLTAESSVDHDSSQETSLMVTELELPPLLLAHGVGPNTQVFEWIAPAESRISELEESSVSALNDSVSNDSVSTDSVSTDSASTDSVSANSVSTDSVSDPASDNPNEPNLASQNEAETLTISSTSCETADPCLVSRSQHAPQEVVPNAEIFAEDVEACFADALQVAHTFTSTDRIHTESFYSHSTIDLEQIALYFSLAEDALEGRLTTATEVTPITSDAREIRSEEISQALGAVEAQITKAEGPAPLKDFIQESIQSGGHEHGQDHTTTEVSFLRRTFAGLIDLSAVLLFALIISSLLQRGGLASIMADLTVNGLQPHHRSWLISGVSLAPLCLVGYHLITLSLLNGTCGTRIFGFSYRIPNGRPIRAQHILVRSLTAPLTTVMAGAIPLLWGARPLGDLLSATTPYVSEDD